MQKVAFIINPKAGVKKKMDVPAFIEEHFSKIIPKEIILWKNKDDFESIKERVLTGGFTIAVAVGGDGTVNQLAATLNNTNIALGILPFGSGNGLARSIGVPMDIKAALNQIERGKVNRIDSGTINNIPFFCTSGIGFDAHIGNLFASSTTRGFSTYFKIIRRELFSYKPKTYELTIDGEKIKREAFLITFANAGQYGNDFYIAPLADMRDGILHISIVKPFSLFMAPVLAYKAFKKRTHLSKYVETFTGKDISVKISEPSPIHFDGEPTQVEEDLSVKVYDQTLNVVVP
ncbi:MAG: YegS/Rv2252/BmrU family lipid kinase [Bacteroidota bacterium]|nr:YegS/Rv2252/BmrU family lipid kinase [Bacteroidota bacterium]